MIDHTKRNTFRARRLARMIRRARIRRPAMKKLLFVLTLAVMPGVLDAQHISTGSGSGAADAIPSCDSDTNPTNALCVTAGGLLVLEGATADTIETFITTDDPTVSDKTISFPNGTGTVAINTLNTQWTAGQTFQSVALVNDAGSFDLGTFQDASLKYAIAQTPDSLVFGLSSDSNGLIIVEKADMATDFAHAFQTNPTLFIQSADSATVADYISFAHDQTDAVVTAGSGDLLLNIASNQMGAVDSLGFFVTRSRRGYSFCTLNTAPSTCVVDLSLQRSDSVYYVTVSDHAVLATAEAEGGIQLGDGGGAHAQPTCSATTRGLFWVDEGGAGVKDSVDVCAKDAGDAYAWRGVALSNRNHPSGVAKALTSATATAIAQVSVASGASTGFTVNWTVAADDGTDFQTRRGSTYVAVVNKAGTETCVPGDVGAQVVAVSLGTLTVATTCSNSPTNAVNFELNAVSSLTETTLEANWTILMDGPGTVTPQ